MQYYACKKINHILKNCPNRIATRGLVSCRVTFVDDQNKGRVNFVEIQDETLKKSIADFEQSLRNDVDVMATKRTQE